MFGDEVAEYIKKRAEVTKKIQSIFADIINEIKSSLSKIGSTIVVKSEIYSDSVSVVILDKNVIISVEDIIRGIGKRIDYITDEDIRAAIEGVIAAKIGMPQ
ncbi:MAG: hypothetical protein ABSA82_01665 [Thermacetogeniaceae bacterium]|jgi:fructose-1,6-bisphosphatase/sedoheptulose 1,7-bisphosphatase-like protein